MNLQTVRRLQKNVHRLSYLVEVSHCIRVLSSTDNLSLILRLSALLLCTYLTNLSPVLLLTYLTDLPVSATVYLSHQSFSCATAYISHRSSILGYCVLIAPFLQAHHHNLHMLYIFLFLWNIPMVNFNFYYNYLLSMINHEYSLCSLILIIITFNRSVS